MKTILSCRKKRILQMSYNIVKTEYSDIGEILYTGELENGLRIMVVPKPGFSSYYALFGTKYGGAMRRFEYEGSLQDTPAGIAHFLEHKMFDMPEGDNALSVLSENGADPNAFTCSDCTCYYFRCAERFEDNLRLLLRFVSTPYFTPESVQKEQGIIGQEILMGEDNPGTVLYYGFLSQLYEHHPIKDKVAGSIESISQITDETLYACHSVFYAPSNMVLCIEGDVDPGRIFEIAAEMLPSEKKSVPHADFGGPEGPLPACTAFEAEMPVSRPIFMFGAKCNPSAELKERLTALLALKLLVGPSSAFYTRLYAAGTLDRNFDFDCNYAAGTGTVMISGESDSPEAVYEEFIKELASVAKNGFDEGCFTRAVRSLIGGQLRGLEDFDNVCCSLAMDYFEGYCSFDALKALESVTKADCEAWLASELGPERLALAVVRPLKGD